MFLQGSFNPQPSEQSSSSKDSEFVKFRCELLELEIDCPEDALPDWGHTGFQGLGLRV